MKNSSHKPKNTSQAQAKPQGATSLLLVIGMALVFIVMITGLTSLSIRQSRQASNTDLSNRALATAEASARDAALWIQANPGKDYPDCSSGDADPAIKSLIVYTPTNSTNNTTEIVCRTVTVSSATPSGQIKKDESVQLFTYEPSGAGIDTMSFQWGKNSALLPSGDINFKPWPTLDKYTTDYSNAPAVVELSLYYWPKNATAISPIDGIKVKTVLLYSSGDFVKINTDNPGRLTSSICKVDYSSGYNCKVGINLSTILGAGGSPVDAKTYNIVAKLKPRYKDTDYQASFCTLLAGQNSTNACSDNAVAVRSSRALIDVTAKVGSLYRRITAETEIGGSSFFDDVLYSNSPIEKTETFCGNFTKKDDPACSPKT